MHKIIILALLSILAWSCKNTIKERPKQFLTENSLKEIAEKAINGERIYNDTLGGLIDYSLPLNSGFNTLQVERIITPVNKTFFALLMEYPNPVYNRFAVYDSSLHLVLMDKALNGNIGLKTINLDNRQYIEINESFLSKDILGINRVSLFRIDSAVTLVFRTFTKFSTPKNEYCQIITELSRERIITKLSSIKRSLLSNKSEIFMFDDKQKKYLSQGNIFINFIKAQDSAFKRVAEKPEITDQNSLLQSVGITKEADTIKTASNIMSKAGYYLTLDEGWKEIKDISLYVFTNRLRGDKYYNPIMGTNIFISQISGKDSAEMFVKTKLLNLTQGKYRVRFTKKTEQGKFYVQYFEFSCGERKYLMIFEASKYTYEKYKTTYQDIINSFEMEY
jgi:hypothetical protein